MLARKLLLGLRKKLPDLGRQRVVLLHLVDTAVGVGETILKKWERWSAAQALPSEGIGGGHVGLVLFEAGRDVTRNWDMARLAAALSGSVVSGGGGPYTWPSRKAKVVLGGNGAVALWAVAGRAL
jgi:hypothetical protein